MAAAAQGSVSSGAVGGILAAYATGQAEGSLAPRAPPQVAGGRCPMARATFRCAVVKAGQRT